MARAEANWERLVRAALRGERLVGGAYGHPVTGIAGIVPSSLGNNVHIEEVLRTADEIQDEDPTVARILRQSVETWLYHFDMFTTCAVCEHAYALAQNLDPNSEGRGVLQFKTGLCQSLGEKHRVDELIADEMKLRESAVFSGNLGELERKTLKRKKVLATLKVLWSVIEDLTKEISPEDAEKLISEETNNGFCIIYLFCFIQMKKVMQNDAARTEDVIAYNIIPLDALSTTTNAIVNFPEVRAAISALQYHRDLPRLPSTFSVPDARNSDMLDFLQCVFGFQEGNVKNQREHIVHLLANEQSRLGKLLGNEPLFTLDLTIVLVTCQKIDEGAVHVVFSKSLDNYIKWCNYLPIRPVWNNIDSLTKEKKLLYVCLYYLMWGEAANVRFLPEDSFYVLILQLARELEEVKLRKHTAEPAESCKSSDGASFLDRVISPLYETLAAETANNKNGRAAHSEWRNYDDFNEFFWSLNCFNLGWPWKLENLFFSKPSRKDKVCFIDHGHSIFILQYK
ncbi:hypothetical protein PR202_ga27282 [Eleusine coracana subsp. coracana]|uniref:1,3-beta-glucan synthase component FKS1-like domain-containing protein n=1 Tax=Eleusine coracana subsp. coracana TaxID=191504 RepID=A0AAV5DFT0_ELECO|nr:hypothetical protein PR202_ga27282 [Eleusine coracana subsp. coracana]